MGNGAVAAAIVQKLGSKLEQKTNDEAKIHHIKCTFAQKYNGDTQQEYYTKQTLLLQCHTCLIEFKLGFF